MKKLVMCIYIYTWRKVEKQNNPQFDESIKVDVDVSVIITFRTLNSWKHFSWILSPEEGYYNRNVQRRLSW